MLKFGLPLLALAGHVLIMTRALSVPIKVAPLTAVSGIMIVLFLSDFAGMLQGAALALYVVGIAASGFYLLRWSRTRKSWPGKTQVLWGAVSLIFICALYWLNRHAAFHSWDEFSHWGTVIKVIYESDTFHFTHNTLYFQDYPPGTALFAYFILQATAYTEGAAYFAYGMIVFAALFATVGLAARNSTAAALALIPLSVALIFKLGNPLDSVLIDHIISVMFAGSVAACFIVRNHRAGLWPVATILGALVLTKQAGNSLALVAGSIALAGLMTDLVFFHSDKPLKRLTIHGKALAFNATLILGMPWALGALWKYHVISGGLNRSYPNMTLQNILPKAFACCTSERDVAILSDFFHAWSRLPLLLTAILLVIWSVAALNAHTRKEGWLLAQSGIILLGGYLAYSTAQLCYYLFGFSEHDARALVSFDRFQNVYLLGWALVAAAIAGQTVSGARQIFVLCALCLLVSIGMRSSAREFLVHGGHAMAEVRTPIDRWARYVGDAVSANSRVYIVWQGSNGEHFWYMHYALQPRKTNLFCYSLGKPLYPGDIWTCDRDLAALKKELQEFDYLAVGNGLVQLRTIYPELFAGSTIASDAKGGVFAIIKLGDGKIVLQPGGLDHGAIDGRADSL